MFDVRCFPFAALALLALVLLAPPTARAGGDEVVVVYNSRMPESKAVAEHYAAVRGVPAWQVFGFGLTTNEVISRADFTEFLQKPLADRLEAARLWTFGDIPVFPTNAINRVTRPGVIQSKIRYAVLCYGIPLKIAPEAALNEFAAKVTPDPLNRNEAAVDSELAWLPRLKEKLPLTGPLLNPYYATTNAAQLNCTNGILLVARLDGPTPEIASALVDKALFAENNGLWGRAYFDARGLDTNDTYYPGDASIIAAADMSRRLGFETELDTNAATLPASFPMSHIALYAGWYEGNVSGPFTAPKMEFMPGALAYHIHSFSADTLRSATRNWCGPLLAKGATGTMGSVYEPYLSFTPNIAFVLTALGNGFTFGEAAWGAQTALSWQTTVIGDPLYRPFAIPSPALHARLTAAQSPLLEWSYDRLIRLDLNLGLRAPELIEFLNTLPITTRSAVLMERLGSLYDAAGKPNSAITAWQKAVALTTSPQQRLRLRLTLGEKLTALNRQADAAANYRQLLQELPDYAARPAIEAKITALETR